MPLEWQHRPTTEASEESGASSSGSEEAPALRLCLWPHRSLTPEGFAIFIAITAVMLLVPLLPLLGTPALWGLLPFMTGAVWLVWTALRRSFRDGTVTEILSMWPTRIHLVRRDPGKPAQEWEADPYWVSVHLHPTGGPVENYVTLRGSGREVEIGAFLSADERLSLRDDLERALIRLRNAPLPG